MKPSNAGADRSILVGVGHHVSGSASTAARRSRCCATEIRRRPAPAVEPAGALRG